MTITMCLKLAWTTSIASQVKWDNNGHFVLTENATSVMFISDSSLDDETSPLIKFLNIEKLTNLKGQKVKAITEAKAIEESTKEEGDIEGESGKQVKNLLKMVGTYVPGYLVESKEMGLDQVIGMETIVVSFLPSKTGKMAFVGAIPCENHYNVRFFVGEYSPDSFVGSPNIQVPLTGQYMV